MNYLKTIIALLSILIVLLGVYIQMPEKNCSTGNTIVIPPEQVEKSIVKLEMTPFEKEFFNQRNYLGPNRIFEWNGKKYTTNYKKRGKYASNSDSPKL